MTPRAKHIREQVVKAEEELANRKGELAQLERTCPHEWETLNSKPGRKSIHRRQCLDCGKVEETTKTKITHEPDFGAAHP